MKKLINKILFWYYRNGITQMAGAFYDSEMQPKVVDAQTLNRLTKQWGWAGNKVRQVHYLCIHFGIIEQCNHPLFKKRIAYRLVKEMRS